MSHPYNVISLSGGKDSTAMLLNMVERGEAIADIVFFDTGWEFPEMYDHLEQIEYFIGRTVTRLRPRLPVGVVTEKSPFDWFFSEYPVRKRGTDHVHIVEHFTHGGWPRPLKCERRWCTGRKQESLKSHVLAQKALMSHSQGFPLPLHQCIGFAADEDERVTGTTKQSSAYITQRFPLIDWGDLLHMLGGADALAYCKPQAIVQGRFTWGGLYERFSRVSCFCCPMQSAQDLRTLYRHYPHLWHHMRVIRVLGESWLAPPHMTYVKGHRFSRTSVSAMDERFRLECTECNKCGRWLI